MTSDRLHVTVRSFLSLLPQVRLPSEICHLVINSSLAFLHLHVQEAQLTRQHHCNIITSGRHKNVSVGLLFS